MRMLIKNGRLVDPSQGIDAVRDLLLVEGKVAAIGANLKNELGHNGRNATEFDAKGLVVAPGFIDMHTHLREPGYEHKETVHTGVAAAVAGGFSAVACMPNTNPVNDNAGVCAFIKGQALAADLARVYPIAAISLGLKGERLTDFSDLLSAGAVAFSDDGKPLANSAMMRHALEYAASLGAPLVSHCEEPTLASGGVANEGIVATELGLKGMPTVAEDLMVAREIMLSEYLGARVHIAHVSSANSVRMLREAKKRGVLVSAEAAPHHFTLTEEALVGYNTNAKVNPPLRTAADVQEVRNGLSDGTIDCIASDHAPHASNDKEVEFDAAAFGMIGLETAVGLSLRLVKEGFLSFSSLVTRMSCNPAKILSVAGGTLRIGSVADVTIIDPRRKWKVEKDKFRSKGRNTPFVGWSLTGKAVMTIVGGVVKFSDDASL